MTNSQERKENNSSDPRAINIEIPQNCFEGMFKMMSGKGEFSEAVSKCCEGFEDTCCPQTGDNDEHEIRIVIKKKEK